MLSVRDLCVTYRSSAGSVPAVRGVSFEVSRGETVGIAGESGCGKSSVAMALLRLTPAVVTGSIELAGHDVLTMRPGQLRAARWAEASVVFQGAQHVLNPVLRIGRQIDEAIELHGPARPDRVGELLELVGLPGRRAMAFPHELSGGQKQRAMIAMALACDPELLIADEPTTALDVMVQAQVLQLLDDIRRERGLSVVFITHDLSVLAGIADRVLVMYAGRIIEEGPAADVLATPQHPYTAALAAAFPTIGDPASRHHPAGLAGDPPDPTALPAGCPFEPRCVRRILGCDQLDVELRPSSPGRRAACVHVGVSS